MDQKFIKMCRTCLSEERKLCSLFDKRLSVENVTLQEVISVVTRVNISKEDGLPNSICIQCKRRATDAYLFKQKTQEADATLRQMINDKTTIETTDALKVKPTDAFNVKIEFEDLDQIRADQNGSFFSQISLEHLKNDDNSSNHSAPEKTNNYDHNDFSNNILESSHIDDLWDSKELKVVVKAEQDLECKQCLGCFVSESDLKTHLSTCVKVKSERLSYCVCGEGFVDAATLFKHVWIVHNKSQVAGIQPNRKKQSKTIKAEKYTCGLCCLAYKHKENHAKEHKRLIVYSCDEYQSTYLKRQYAELHLKKLCLTDSSNPKLDEENGVHCKSNEVNTAVDGIQEDSLITITHITAEEFLKMKKITDWSVVKVCQQCTGVFLNPELLELHTDNHHPEYSKKCQKCTKSFASAYAASRHRSACRPVEYKWECPTCFLKFPYELNLNKHILRSHEGQKVSLKFINPQLKSESKVSCEICAKSFYREETLVRHMDVHNTTLQWYECDICKKKFSRKDNLKSHLRVHDPARAKPSPSLCLYCGRSFTSSSNLVVHMRRHTGEKPYVCDFCGKGFPRSSDLQCHRRMHTGEKPCVCTVCDKAFSRKTKLVRHMRIHTGLRPYKCSHCSKAFSQSNDLTLHLRRHTGDKPYVCEVCGDRFIQGTALRNHRRVTGHFIPNTPSDPDAPREVVSALAAFTLNTVAQASKTENDPPCAH